MYVNIFFTVFVLNNLGMNFSGTIKSRQGNIKWVLQLP